MRWRRTLVILHRDVGYLCLGITLAYAISGVAVNHRQHWDYNFTTDTDPVDVGSPAALLGVAAGAPGELARRQQGALVQRLLAVLGREGQPQRVYWRSPDRLTLVFETGERDVVDYLPSEGRAEQIKRRPRAVFRQLNFLHLNEGKGLWTYVADSYAVALFFMAISGALIVKGKKGLRGRGGLLALGGFGVVLLGLLFYGGLNP